MQKEVRAAFLSFKPGSTNADQKPVMVVWLCMSGERRGKIYERMREQSEWAREAITAMKSEGDKSKCAHVTVDQLDDHRTPICPFGLHHHRRFGGALVHGQKVSCVVICRQKRTNGLFGRIAHLILKRRNES